MKPEGKLRLSGVLSRGSPARGIENFPENCLPALCDHHSRRKEIKRTLKEQNSKGGKKKLKTLKTLLYLFKQPVFTECPLCASWTITLNKRD